MRVTQQGSGDDQAFLNAAFPLTGRSCLIKAFKVFPKIAKNAPILVQGTAGLRPERTRLCERA